MKCRYRTQTICKRGDVEPVKARDTLLIGFSAADEKTALVYKNAVSALSYRDILAFRDKITV